MKVVVDKLAAIILVVLFFWFVGYNVVRYFNKPYKTEIVVEDTAVDSINVKGIAFRDEKVITHDYDGVLRYLYEDASLVNKGTTVMEVYPSNSDILNIDKIEYLTKEKEEYEKLSNIRFNSTASTDLLTKEIDKKIFDILSLADSKNMIYAGDEKLELAMLMNKKNIYIGSKVDYGTKIEKLDNTILNLQNLTAPPQDTIVTEIPGYFVKFTDGYEKIYNTSMVRDLTVEKFKELMAEQPEKLNENDVGKTIENYNWYFSFTVSKLNMLKFKNSLNVDVNLHLSDLETIPADIVAITESQEDDTYLITLKMKYISDEIATIRTQTVEVEFRFYSGLRVSKDAIRFLNDQRGVYVVGTDSIHFVPVNVVYEDKSYVVCTVENGENNLKIYDKVVIGGNVYDGKPLQSRNNM